MIPDDPEASVYRFIIVAAKRARQLQGGARATANRDGRSAPWVCVLRRVSVAASRTDRSFGTRTRGHASLRNRCASFQNRMPFDQFREHSRPPHHSSLWQETPRLRFARNLHDWSRRERLAIQVKRQRNSDADKCHQLRRTTKALIGRIPTYGPIELGLLFSELLQIETALRFRAIQIEQERKGNFACGRCLTPPTSAS